MDCSPFLNWDEEKLLTENEQPIIFRSLVATITSQPSLNESLKAKAVEFLESVEPDGGDSDALLTSLASPSDETLTGLIQCIVVLVSSPMQIIVSTTINMLNLLISSCSSQVLLALVNADMIPLLITILSPLSLSFTKAKYIHTYLIANVTYGVMLATRLFLTDFKSDSHDNQQAVCETVLKQVLVPSEQYIRHLCVNRYSIVDGYQCEWFLDLLAQLLQTCPYYQPTMDFVLHMPVCLAITSCLTFFENHESIRRLFNNMVNFQADCIEQSRDFRRSGTTMMRSLKMEGFDDVMEQRLLYDETGDLAEDIAIDSTELNILLGMNIEELE
ncbi:hypothetical protein BLNAU_5351 [Blattamonas nauphoetae]|uniref:Uncharacterized protein n=1 Tax=Blattamonas nauphoetae TaxID=2049346 RepID=A0ABQ9Y7A0_9EUKA|nr:hypothetical protein BLNAU_5351 [Blattamonas nauphoetae]